MDTARNPSSDLYPLLTVDVCAISTHIPKPIGVPITLTPLSKPHAGCTAGLPRGGYPIPKATTCPLRPLRTPRPVIPAPPWTRPNLDTPHPTTHRGVGLHDEALQRAARELEVYGTDDGVGVVVQVLLDGGTVGEALDLFRGGGLHAL